MDTNLQKYMAFLKTVEYGSFTKAAEVLHYSQSGISRMISDLEKEWNLSVLERGRSGVRTKNFSRRDELRTEKRGGLTLNSGRFSSSWKIWYY